MDIEYKILLDINSLNYEEGYLYFHKLSEKNDIINYYLKLLSISKLDSKLKYLNNEKIYSIISSYKKFNDLVYQYLNTEEFKAFYIYPADDFFYNLKTNKRMFFKFISMENNIKLFVDKKVIIQNHLHLKFTKKEKKYINSIINNEKITFDFEYKETIFKNFGYNDYLLYDNFNQYTTEEKFNFFIQKFNLIHNKDKMATLIFNNFFINNVYGSNQTMITTDKIRIDLFEKFIINYKKQYLYFKDTIINHPKLLFIEEYKLFFEKIELKLNITNF